jgi:SAM-dependent methyltransferase
MDEPTVAPEVLAACLADLAKVNTVTLARPPTLAWLKRALRGLGTGGGFTLLDVGYGQGDMLRAIYAWSVRAKLRPRLFGIDLSPSSAPAARAATNPAWPIAYLVGDVLDFEPPVDLDFVISSLVTHHMTDDQLVRFIGWMEANARRGWFINDLHRHPIAYYGFSALSFAARWHPFVRHDGPLSVARAFRRMDWQRVLAKADIAPSDVSIDWRFPFRLCVGRLK